jgi:dihydroflavonol-4-reductase
MARSAFVTGANGFVGLNLVEELLRQGWQVTAMHRPTSDVTYLRRLAAERVEGDVTDAASVRRAMPEAVDVVFHVAGDTGLWSGNNVRQDRINIEGTRNTVAAALARRAGRLVATSTMSVLGMQSGRLDERSPRLGHVSPVNYQRSKYFAEEEVRAGMARGLDAVILNPAAIVGAYDTRTCARLFRAVAEGRLPGVPPGALSFCHAREVARAHVAAAARGRTGESYALGGTDASVLELVGEIGAVLGRKVPARTLPAWLVRAAGWAGAVRGALTGRAPEITPELARMSLRTYSCTYSCNCEKAVRELDFRIVPLRDMVADCAAWMIAEGLLQAGVNWRRRVAPQRSTYRYCVSCDRRLGAAARSKRARCGTLSLGDHA